MKEKEQTGKRKKVHKKVHRRHRLRIPVQLVVVLVGLLVCIGGTFAWYTWLERAADSKDAEVMEPYYLYLRDENDTEMVRLALDSLFAGETKNLYFCVSNGPNEESGTIGEMGGGNFDYTMELVYTQNVPLTFKLYELDSFEDTAMADGGTLLTVNEDKTAERHQAMFGNISVDDIVNKGKYDTYINGKDGEKLHLETGMVDGKETYMSRYFRLEVTCDAKSFDNYRKETDMIYLLVKAEQPKPTKRTEQP